MGWKEDFLATLGLGEDANLSCIAASVADPKTQDFDVRFPCDVSAPVAVSVAIAAGGIALLFVYYLMSAVRNTLLLLCCSAPSHAP